ncbi:MAG TPA: phosphoribosylanthranilate isomerase [Verrucomicrobiae bacterium]|nr:phosphoribosylanthranilate isomerase [Verrucomicrobiae bacterium]
MSVKVKICGITSAADAFAAAEAGADAIGLMFYEKSPRYVCVSEAAAIVRNLPPFVLKVGVFVDPPEDLVFQAITECGLNVVQFHGNESPEFCVQFGVMSIKAFRVRDADSLKQLADYPTDAWLLDAFSEKSIGGTGEQFNWDLALQAKQWGRLIFLAGGLTPKNVGDAVTRVQPFAVDVSSGVESAPGVKDHVKVREFIRAAKGEPA